MLHTNHGIGEREREREREKQTDRQAGRKTDRQRIDGQTDRQTDRQVVSRRGDTHPRCLHPKGARHKGGHGLRNRHGPMHAPVCLTHPVRARPDQLLGEGATRIITPSSSSGGHSNHSNNSSNSNKHNDNNFYWTLSERALLIAGASETSRCAVSQRRTLVADLPTLKREGTALRSSQVPPSSVSEATSHAPRPRACHQP